VIDVIRTAANAVQGSSTAAQSGPGGAALVPEKRQRVRRPVITTKRICAGHKMPVNQW